MNRPPPTPERQEELREIILSGAEELRDLKQYHDWDDFIECEEILSYEEWVWCATHWCVRVTATIEEINVSEKGELS